MARPGGGMAMAVAAMAAVIALANVLVQFPVALRLGPLDLADILTWAAFVYPLTFLVNDLTNRTLGPFAARRVVFATEGKDHGVFERFPQLWRHDEVVPHERTWQRPGELAQVVTGDLTAELRRLLRAGGAPAAHRDDVARIEAIARDERVERGCRPGARLGHARLPQRAPFLERWAREIDAEVCQMIGRRHALIGVARDELQRRRRDVSGPRAMEPAAVPDERHAPQIREPLRAHVQVGPVGIGHAARVHGECVNREFLRDGRRFIHASIDVDDVRRISGIAPFAWSSYRLDRRGDLVPPRRLLPLEDPTRHLDERAGAVERVLTDRQLHQIDPGELGRVFPDVIWHTEKPILRTAPAPPYPPRSR